MRILGVDPGTVVVGYGVVEENGDTQRAIAFGDIRLSTRKPFPIRLKEIYDRLSNVIIQYGPDEFAIESLFYAENAKVAIKMGHARGVAILAAVNHQIPVAEYSPREIKLSVVGTGGASKQQVQRMIQQLLRMKSLPEPQDASDALAVAVCRLHRMGSAI